MAFSIVYCYLHPDILFSYTMIVGCIIYPCLTWYCMNAYYAEVSTFIFSVYTIKYRFRQVFDRINVCASTALIESSIGVSELMFAIHEHNEICQINHRNNHLMRLILFEVYYAGSLIIDLNILNAFYLDNILIIRILFIFLSFLWVVSLFAMAYASASLEKASHSPYAKLNSIIAKLDMNANSTQISVKNKIKINNLIERLAQTKITVWVLDLFPLNFYQFFLFFAAVVSNFMLIVGLIKLQILSN
jgi:hypothetical protein